MMWRDTLDLIAIVQVDDGGGGYTEQDTFREVFASRKSIRQSEYYQAHAAGLKPEIMFEVRFADYSDERKLRFPAGEGGRRYDIVRTYTKNEETIELVCQREVAT
ncbi:phage head closure protein [Cohnella lubricantis]|uniref:Phage head closure protein n=1 Tax=Cohnella lubricantis TaxID=2163172 RepID=A0A841T322_9BACL|nr:phage head closure protein [Cohnella lubricantis]MBB6675983.1 phage head closure protein [Cohnella lubricantis]MBP2117898.1 SPP1 family predicted phage head-tail adaptor [Cohnella lubricantis]